MRVKLDRVSVYYCTEFMYMWEDSSSDFCESFVNSPRERNEPCLNVSVPRVDVNGERSPRSVSVFYLYEKSLPVLTF